MSLEKPKLPSPVEVAMQQAHLSNVHIVQFRQLEEAGIASRVRSILEERAASDKTGILTEFVDDERTYMVVTRTMALDVTGKAIERQGIVVKKQGWRGPNAKQLVRPNIAVGESIDGRIVPSSKNDFTYDQGLLVDSMLRHKEKKLELGQLSLLNGLTLSDIFDPYAAGRG